MDISKTLVEITLGDCLCIVSYGVGFYLCVKSVCDIVACLIENIPKKAGGKIA